MQKTWETEKLAYTSNLKHSHTLSHNHPSSLSRDKDSHMYPSSILCTRIDWHTHPCTYVHGCNHTGYLTYHVYGTVGRTWYLLPCTVLFHSAMECDHFPVSKIFPCALAGWLRWLQCRPQRLWVWFLVGALTWVAGSTPGQGAYGRQPIDASLSHWCFSFSLSQINKHPWVRIKHKK